MRGQNFVDSDYGKGYIDGHRAGVEDARARIRREEVEPLREALQSIAINTCCDKCHEAAQVAIAALRAADERGK